MADQFTTAVVIGDQRLEWTTVRRRKNRIEIAEQRAVEIPPEEGEPRDRAVTAALAKLRGSLTVALPSRLTLMRVVRLPTTDVAEIGDMAALQVDKFSPFPVEYMAVGHEIVQQDDKSSLVLIGACRREWLDRLGELCRRAGKLPEAVDVSALGWWQLLRQENHVPEKGSALVLIIEDRIADLIVARDGAPLVIRTLEGPREAEAANVGAEVAEEIHFTLASLETEWGLPVGGPLQIWRRKALSADFATSIETACGLPTELHVLESLPNLSEGIARRALARGPHLLDLAPAEWKSEIRARRLRRSLALALGMFALVWLTAVAIVIGLLQYQKRQAAALQQELAGLREPARAVEQLKSQVRSLERYVDPAHSALECLREITERLPPGVELTALTYKKYGQVAVRGEADESDPIYDFFQALEQSRLFVAVKPEGVTQQQRGGRFRSQFRLTLELPPEAR